MAFISHEVAEISSKMAEWKAIANKVNELSKNFSSSNRSPNTLWNILTFLHSSSLDSYADLIHVFFFFYNRKINTHIWSVKQKVFENNTLEQCLNLEENGEEEILHWLLLLSNGLHSRCAGDTGGVCQLTRQGRKQCSTATFLRNRNQSPALPLPAQFSVISIQEVKITLSNIETEQFVTLGNF